MCVGHIMGAREFTTHFGPGAKFSCFPLLKSELPGQPRGGVRGLQMTNEIKIFFSKNKPYKNEIQIRFSKWCENEKRNSYPFFKVKDAKTKTKNEVQMRFSKWCENEKRNSYLFFNVMQKRKMEMECEFHFPMPSKNGWH